MPEEGADFFLCREMGWSWADLQATPRYVRHTFLAFLEAEAEQVERDRRAQERRGDG